MKKLLLLCLSFLMLLPLAACAKSGGHQLPIDHTDITALPLEEALEIIAPGEKLCADITRADTVTRDEADAFVDAMTEIYPPNGWTPPPWREMFFGGEDPNAETLSLNQDLFFPTIYHEDVAITRAEIMELYYQSPFYPEVTDLHLETYLTITVAYVGEQENMAGWYRSYIFRQWPDEQWHMDFFEGQTNLSLPFRTLPLRDPDATDWPQDYWAPGVNTPAPDFTQPIESGVGYDFVL